jgi:hypothetical protein
VRHLDAVPYHSGRQLLVDARPLHHDQVGPRHDLVPAIPGQQPRRGIGPEDGEELSRGVAASQLSEGVSRVAEASPVDLDPAGLETVHRLHGGGHQGVAILRGADPADALLLPRPVGDFEEHLVEVELVADVHRGDEVADVGRIEGATEQA